MRDAGAVHGVARGEVVGAVEHHVAFPHEQVQFGGFDADRDGNDIDVGIDGPQRVARGVGLRRADGVGAVQDLSLQVGEVDRVGVGEAQAADAGGGEVERGGTAEAARADDEHAARAQLLLPLHPDLGEEDMAAVAEELLVVQFVGLTCCFAASVCATVGAWLFTGSPFRKAIACVSWKSSLEPNSIGFISAGGGARAPRTRGPASFPLSAPFLASALPVSWGR